MKDLAAEGRLAALGIEPVSETPQAFARFIAGDAAIAHWTPGSIQNDSGLSQGLPTPSGILNLW